MPRNEHVQSCLLVRDMTFKKSSVIISPMILSNPASWTPVQVRVRKYGHDYNWSTASVTFWRQRFVKMSLKMLIFVCACDKLCDSEPVRLFIRVQTLSFLSGSVCCSLIRLLFAWTEIKLHTVCYVNIMPFFTQDSVFFIHGSVYIHLFLPQ